MAFWTYILRCADERYYTGHTDDLERRIAQHDAGGYCDFTTRRRPVTLVWSQEFATRLEALEAERRVGPWSRRKKEALIAGDWAALFYWAKPPVERPSTSLGTNGEGVRIGTNPQEGSHAPDGDDVRSSTKPFVPSEVEGQVTR